MVRDFKEWAELLCARIERGYNCYTSYNAKNDDLVIQINTVSFFYTINNFSQFAEKMKWDRITPGTAYVIISRMMEKALLKIIRKSPATTSVEG